jgi:hypothetical protein
MCYCKKYLNVNLKLFDIEKEEFNLKIRLWLGLMLSITVLIFLNSNMIIENKTYALSNSEWGDWEYIINQDDSITITNYLGNEKVVIIPGNIDGKIVRRIEGYDYSSIIEITVPSSIEYIDQSIFYRGLVENINVDKDNNQYKSIDGVLFTKNMEKIVAYPMGNDRTTYQIPNGVKVISFNAFSTSIYNGNTALQNIEIPKSIELIEDIHSLAARISNMNVNLENESYKSIDGVLFNKLGEVLLCYPYGNTRTEYKIPEGTIEISRETFKGTYGIKHFLKDVWLPSTLQILPGGFKIEKLQNIFVDENNSIFRSIEGVLFSGSKEKLITYPMGNSRSSYLIPSGVKEIDSEAFYQIHEYQQFFLKNITLPAGLEKYGNNFNIDLENIFVDENHTSLKSVDGVLFSKEGKKLLKYPNLKSVEYYSIPEGTQILDYLAFSGCIKLKGLTIPESVLLIEQSAINYCENLSNVIIYNKDIDIRDYNFYSRMNTTIWSSENSTAYSYAQEHNLIFKNINNIQSVDLSSITLSEGILEPEFTSEMTTYKANVGSQITSITVKPIANELNTHIKINGINATSNIESQDINLDVGENKVLVEVITPDGKTSKIYTIIIHRDDSVKSIAVTSLPIKTNYLVGESLDLTGLEVTATYEGSSREIISLTNDMVSGFDSSSVALNQVVSVTFKDKSTSFMVDISNPPISGDGNTPTIPTTPILEVEVNNGVIITNNKIIETDPQTVINVINKEKSIKDLVIEIADGNNDVNISGSILDALEKKNGEAIIIFVAGNATYEVPLKLIDFADTAKTFGVTSADLKLVFSLIIDNKKAEVHGFKNLSDAIDFKLSLAIPGVNEIELKHFNKPVKRSISITSNLNPLTTVGVVLNSNGTVLAVPTFVTAKRTSANLYRNSNSVYMLIENSKTFKDVDKVSSWAEDYIEKLASRMVINGVDDDYFKPSQIVNRGEFAAILSRGLGLVSKDMASEDFKDVSLSQGFNKNGEIAAAVEAGLILGFEDGTFHPYEMITREQVAIIISRAMDYINSDLVKLNKTKKLSNFKDSKKISTNSRIHIEKVFQAGYLEGYSDNNFHPSYETSRAQMSKILYNFLKSIEYIN